MLTAAPPNRLHYVHFWTLTHLRDAWVADAASFGGV